MVSLGKKNVKRFVGYKDDDYEIKASDIILLKISSYAKSYDSETKWMNLSIKDDEC